MWRNPLVRGLGAGMVVLVLVVFGGVRFVWKPQDQTITQLKQTQDSLKRELQIVSRQEREKERLEQEYAQLMTQWNLLKDVLPQEEDPVGVLRQVYEAAVRSGLTVKAIRPMGGGSPTPVASAAAQKGGTESKQAQEQGQPQQPALTYRAHPFTLEMRGTFYGVMEFARNLLRAQRLGKVDRIQIRYQPEKQQEEGWESFNVEATFVYTVYSFPEGGVR